MTDPLTCSTNLFAELPQKLPEELITILLETATVRIERIVSTGQTSPDGYWYDQGQPEWVVVLKGAGRLLIEGASLPIEMRPGDFVNIPAHKKHRVEWTTPDETTVWLAVFYLPSDTTSR